MLQALNCWDGISIHSAHGERTASAWARRSHSGLMGCPNRGWRRSLHPHARRPAHVRRPNASEATCFGKQWADGKHGLNRSKHRYTVGRTEPNGNMHSDRSEFAHSGHRLQISLRSHIGRTSQLRKLPLPPLPLTLRARHQRRIDILAHDALRCLGTQIAMRLSDWSLHGLVGVNLFEQEQANVKSECNEDTAVCVPNMKFAIAKSSHRTIHSQRGRKGCGAQLANSKHLPDPNQQPPPPWPLDDASSNEALSVHCYSKRSYCCRSGAFDRRTRERAHPRMHIRKDARASARTYEEHHASWLRWAHQCIRAISPLL
jgi:hypothetical protein